MFYFGSCSGCFKMKFDGQYFANGVQSGKIREDMNA